MHSISPIRSVVFSLIFILLGGQKVWAQPQMAPPSTAEIANAPAWARLMVDSQPNVWKVDSAYRAYYRSHPFVKSYLTQYYKRWRRAAEVHVRPDGSIAWPTVEQQSAKDDFHVQKRLTQSASNRGGGGWSILGPLRMYNNNGQFEAEHTNVYSLAQCQSSPNVMVAGTEPGEVYQSNDGGSTWQSITTNTLVNAGVTAVAIDPSQPDHILAGAGNQLKRTTNSGGSWSNVISAGGLNPNEIQFHPSQPQIVLVACETGLYRSTDNGISFTLINNEPHWDVKFKPGNPNTVYTVRRNSALIRHEFHMSTDAGATWTLQDNGWYSSSDPARSTGGARLAVTPADTNRIYAYLIGESKSNDAGFIGVYKSTNGGQAWTLPNPPAGGPYNTNHPNLAIGTPTWLYHQGFYNCALMASSTNPDEILIGGLNLWRSTDGGTTFASVSGYVGGPLGMHVDNQDFRVFGNTYWISTDGGIYRSNDFFQTQPTVSMDGIHGSDYWGFGSGWNHDVLVGGLYHNGNNAWFEGYGAGNHLALGGGEAPTGYVNPGNNFRTYFSDIGGRILPLTIGGPVGGAAFGMSPNETYFSAESSELEFHPNCYNIAYLGKDNGLWRSSDGGGTFTLVHTFGADVDSKLRYIEISRSNPNVIYVGQQPSSGSLGTLWKTTDEGVSWTSLPLPSGPNKRKILLALDAENENHLFVAFPQAGNGNKVFETTNSGTTWTNLTTSILDGESIHSMVWIAGTQDGLYLGTDKTVYYRDDNLSNWVLFDQGLPIQTNSNILKPFYRDGDIRLASYGKGIWTAAFHTQPTSVVATITVDKLSAVCDADSFYFEDYSMINHAGATWSWSFQNGTPATSSLRNPVVKFNGIGTHQVTLEITSANGATGRDTIQVEVTGMTATQLAADFESQFPPQNWGSNSTGNLTWVQDNTLGGFGNSSATASCDNFNVDAGGTFADLWAFVNLSTTQANNLTFDVAYSQYGGQYTDTLEVLVSTDCGVSFVKEYRKGGQSLATAPNYTAGVFVPTASQWRTDTVDLSAYSQTAQVIVAFRNIGHFGQMMYLDNVNLNGSTIVSLENPMQTGYIQLAPNPVVSGSNVVLRTDSQDPVKIIIHDLNGKEVFSAQLQNGQALALGDLAAGTYVWQGTSPNLIRRGKLTVIEGRN
jgi:hypothetical protein